MASSSVLEQDISPRSEVTGCVESRVYYILGAKLRYNHHIFVPEILISKWQWLEKTSGDAY
jgi:hypothetical protein